MLIHQPSQMEDWASDGNKVAEQLCHLQVSSSEADRGRCVFLPLLLCRIADVDWLMTTLQKFHFTFWPWSYLHGHFALQTLSKEVWLVGVADFKLSCGVPSQGNGEFLFSTRSLAAPLGLFYCMVNPRCIAPGTMSIILGILSDRTGLEHFLQICEAHVLNRGFECWHKGRIQFVLHSAINSEVDILQNSEKMKSFLA